MDGSVLVKSPDNFSNDINTQQLGEHLKHDRKPVKHKQNNLLLARITHYTADSCWKEKAE